MAVKATGAQYGSANSLYVYEKANVLKFSLKRKKIIMLMSYYAIEMSV